MRLLNSILVVPLALAALVAVPTLPAADLTALTIVVENAAGEPIPRASITIGRIKSKPGAERLKVRNGRLQLRTSMRGTAPLPPMVQGRYMIQVTSPGYQTHGSADLVLAEPEQTLTVVLEPPKKQISVHKQP
jgi:hypothetical protein